MRFMVFGRFQGHWKKFWGFQVFQVVNRCVTGSPRGPKTHYFRRFQNFQRNVEAYPTSGTFSDVLAGFRGGFEVISGSSSVYFRSVTRSFRGALGRGIRWDRGVGVQEGFRGFSAHLHFFFQTIVSGFQKRCG